MLCGEVDSLSISFVVSRAATEVPVLMHDAGLADLHAIFNIHSLCILLRVVFQRHKFIFKIDIL